MLARHCFPCAPPMNKMGYLNSNAARPVLYGNRTGRTARMEVFLTSWFGVMAPWL
jgi:hypothetical protein